MIPVKRLLEAIPSSDPGWPINCVGNLALLEKSLNVKKKDMTLVEYFWQQVVSGKLSKESATALLDRVQTFFFQPLEEANTPKGIDGKDRITKKWYMTLMQSRSELLLSKFLELNGDNILE